MIQKAELRKLLLAKRASLPEKRRHETSLALQRRFCNEKGVLSFVSFGSEIDLQPLNQDLASRRELYLPRVVGNSIVPYRVDRMDQLARSSLGILEPDPACTVEVSFAEVQCILVPGLGFDIQGYRVGYGKGHYDRLLAQECTIRTIGVGFREQLIDNFPKDPWDIPVQELFLC